MAIVVLVITARMCEMLSSTAEIQGCSLEQMLIGLVLDISQSILSVILFRPLNNTQNLT